jgi:preprotein translocase SecE subunit
MAKQTRAQRRARREKQAAQSGGGVVQRARARQQQVRPAAQPERRQTGRREPVQRGRFIRESWGELKKVEWPSQAQVVQGTIVVLIACAIVGAYLFAADQVFKPFVRNVLLGQ